MIKEGEIMIDGKKVPVKIKTGDDDGGTKIGGKLQAMRIALTYVESQELKITPEKTIKIANIFLKWLNK